MLKAAREAGFEHSLSEIANVPEATISLDEESTKKVLRLIERLDDHDDVQNVTTNLDIPDDINLDE